jgi:hypothetical protein
VHPISEFPPIEEYEREPMIPAILLQPLEFAKTMQMQIMGEAKPVKVS